MVRGASGNTGEQKTGGWYIGHRPHHSEMQWLLEIRRREHEGRTAGIGTAEKESRCNKRRHQGVTLGTVGAVHREREKGARSDPKKGPGVPQIRDGNVSR